MIPCFISDSEMFPGLVTWLPNIIDRQYMKTLDEVSLMNEEMYVLHIYMCAFTYTHGNQSPQLNQQQWEYNPKTLVLKINSSH